MNRSAIFLDRDGVINRNRAEHVKSWGEFCFLSGALDALRQLATLAWPVVVVSNQSAIGRGLVNHHTVDRINARMVASVCGAGGRIDDVLYCPHRPDEGCDCREPQPGLLLAAADRLGLDLARSFLIGDAESDVLAAHAVGCQPVLVTTGRGVEQIILLQQHGVDGFHVAEDLSEAVRWILGQIKAEANRQVRPP